MTWQFNLYAIPFLLTILPLGYCAQLAWQRRSRLPERLFLVLMATLLWLVVVYALRLLSSDPGLIVWLAKVEYPANQLAAAFWFLFILAYLGHEQWITRRNVGLLCLFPLVYMGIVWSNEFHHLHWSQVGVTQINSTVVFSYEYSYSLTFWLSIAYVYLLLMMATVVILRKLTRTQALFRRQSRTLLVASLLPWAATVVDLSGLNPLPGVDVTLFALLLSVGLVAWSLFRLRLLELAPAAHDMVVRSMSDAVLVLDTEQRIVEANPAAARLLRASIHELIGKPMLEFFPYSPERFERLLGDFEVADEVSCIVADQTCHFDVRVSMLRNPWDSPRGHVVILRNITEQKHAEQQTVQLAVEKERVSLLREFIDATSHDLNTPLTTLRISTDLLRVYTDRLPVHMAKLHGPNVTCVNQATLAELEKLVTSVTANGARIHESTIRLQRMVSEMLEMVRLDKEQPLQKRAASLNEVGQQAIAELGALKSEKDVALQFEADGSLPDVIVDEKQIGIALKHLLRNAVTHTPSGGVVTLQTRAAGEWAVMEVIDTGIGIPASDLPRVFERFYRADTTRGAQTGGMGLGLAIVKKIVSSHQGSVEVESVVGHGSTFRVCLPLARRTNPLRHSPEQVRTPV